MLAFTIQFPNNNPAPPQQHPKTNTSQRPASIQQDILAANTGQTPKHQEPLTQANTTRTLPTGRTPATIHQERRLVASKPNSMPNHTNHTTPPPLFQHHNNPKDHHAAYSPATTPCSHSQYPTHTTQPHKGSIRHACFPVLSSLIFHP